MQEKEEKYIYRRNRSIAIVVRDGKILMERVIYFGREFYTVPGGGIEELKSWGDEISYPGEDKL